jgi:enoyl-CoA hydratase/carnithine racemase
MTVHYDVDGRVATVRLDRPEVFNALNRETLVAIRDSFVKASADHHVGVVVPGRDPDPPVARGADLDLLFRAFSHVIPTCEVGF